MEDGRMVLRRPDPNDGRVSMIDLTRRGRRATHAVQLARKERVATLLQDWTDQDRRDLGRLLAKFNDGLSYDIAHGA